MPKATAIIAAQSNSSKIQATIAVGVANSKAITIGGAASGWATTIGRTLNASIIANIIFAHRRAATNGVSPMGGSFWPRLLPG